MDSNKTQPSDKEIWLLGVLTNELEVPTSQIAKGVDVSQRTILCWRQNAEKKGIPTGTYDGPNRGWIFPPTDLIELFMYVAVNVRPHTYKWMQNVIENYKNANSSNF